MKANEVKKIERAVSRLVRAAKNSSGKLRRYRINRYFQSHHAIRAAALSARENMKEAKRPSIAQVEALSANLDPYAKSAEIVMATGIPDGTGHWKRILNDFGLEHRTRQQMVVVLLKELAELQPQQYILQGGMPAAIQRVIDLMGQGYLWGIEIDVSKYFSSFVGDKLYSLIPLPKEVIDHTILAKNLNIVPSKGTLHMVGPASEGDPAPALEEFLDLARRGIPQGSAASSIVAEMLLSCVFVGLPQCGYCVNYGDNILVLAKSEQDAVSMFKTVESALMAHPAGPLTPKVKFFAKGEGIIFLGHSFSVEGGKVVVRPSPEREHKFDQRLQSAVRTVKKHKRDFNSAAMILAAQRARRFLLGWMAAFSACTDIDQRKTSAILKINGALGFTHTDTSWSKVKPHNWASGLEWEGD